jgi:hypothetical protein
MIRNWIVHSSRFPITSLPFMARLPFRPPVPPAVLRAGCLHQRRHTILLTPQPYRPRSVQRRRPRAVHRSGQPTTRASDRPERSAVLKCRHLLRGASCASSFNACARDDEYAHRVHGSQQNCQHWPERSRRRCRRRWVPQPRRLRFLLACRQPMYAPAPLACFLCNGSSVRATTAVHGGEGVFFGVQPTLKPTALPTRCQLYFVISSPACVA